jgi:hypothetical protein
LFVIADIELVLKAIFTSVYKLETRVHCDALLPSHQSAKQSATPWRTQRKSAMTARGVYALTTI